MTATEDANAIDLKDAAAYSHWTTGIIRYSDLDPNGHVNNGAVNAFLEDGRVRFRDERMLKLGDDILTGFVIAKFSVEYLAPLHYPGQVDIGTVVTRVGRSSYQLGQAVFEGGVCAAVAEVITVLYDGKAGKAVPMSDQLKEILSASRAPANS